MSARINYAAVAPAATQAAVQLETTLKNSGLDPNLFELVKIRASQINGCAFCIHMHTTDATKHGETPMRLFLLDAWRESPLYSPRERAALAWTESLTEIADKGAPDALYQELKQHFSEAEIVNLTMLIGMINLWNRLAIGLAAQHPVRAADKRAS
jgi:AhpD family alkylhydroperoxidase